ncbi:phage antirepressor KilAC domain-containing protein [Loigolactobacillus zhaoyuanensis]|uniref:phage antirepressor KilAC domain-containing protein n=1 Tax=Loigolactobacillus zhaoyuanensis TaxID=2486017 RepID=UPI001CDCB35A|nr:phage regulatory protein/antirepressor Ant [Loigolactobacillus zhaoyuanensis]
MNSTMNLPTNQVVTLDSREVAQMTNQAHKELLRTIRKYTSILTSAKLRSLDFFIPSDYEDSKHEVRPCYLITKKGCEMIGAKLRGDRGTVFVAQYVSKFNSVPVPAEMADAQFPVPKTYAEALRLAADTAERNERLRIDNEVKTQKIAEYEPKISYLDRILNSHDALTVSQVAADYGMSAIELNQVLRDEHIQRKVNGQWLLYRAHMHKGWTKSKTHRYFHTNGDQGVAVSTRWTQKGRLAIHQILEARGIYALMDQEALNV